MSRLVRAIVGLGLTAIAFWIARPAEVGRVAARADLSWIAAAVGLVVIDRVLMAYRWIVLLRGVDRASRPPLAEILRIFFVSTFLGTFLPSAGGDVVRAYSLARHGVGVAASAASVLMDRLLGAIAIVLVAAASISFAGPLEREATAMPLLVSAAACTAALWVMFSAQGAHSLRRVLRSVGWPRLQQSATRLLDATLRYAGQRAVLINVLAGSLAVQILRIVQAYCLGRALHIDAAPAVYFSLVPLILLIMLLPVTINGLGTSQVAFIWLFGVAGIAEPRAFALSILFVALGAVGNLPGGLLYALGRSTPPDRRVEGAARVP